VERRGMRLDESIETLQDVQAREAWMWISNTVDPTLNSLEPHQSIFLELEREGRTRDDVVS
jgi:hypothetical protein